MFLVIQNPKHLCTTVFNIYITFPVLMLVSVFFLPRNCIRLRATNQTSKYCDCTRACKQLNCRVKQRCTLVFSMLLERDFWRSSIIFKCIGGALLRPASVPNAYSTPSLHIKKNIVAQCNDASVMYDAR